MIFLPLFLFAAYTHLVLAIRGLVLTGRDALIAQVHFVVCLVGALGLLLGLEMVPDPRKGIAGDAYNWCVVAFFVFGLLTVVMFGAKLLRVARTGTRKAPLSMRFATTALAVAAGLYLCATAVDHWMFFRDFENSGVAAASFVGPDVKCGTSVLVRIEGGRVIYRCPSRLVLGRDYGQPFVPWPAYRQGTADASAMRRQMAAAIGVQIDPRSTSAAFQEPASALRIFPAANVTLCERVLVGRRRSRQRPSQLFSAM